MSHKTISNDTFDFIDTHVYFDNYRICKVHVNEEKFSFDDDTVNLFLEEDEWLLPEDPDIFSDEHPWDTSSSYRFSPEVWLYGWVEDVN
jgi:hypothetical protein